MTVPEQQSVADVAREIARRVPGGLVYDAADGFAVEWDTDNLSLAAEVDDDGRIYVYCTFLQSMHGQGQEVPSVDEAVNWISKLLGTDRVSR